METRKIFLASSSELVEDRREFEIQVCRQNKKWFSDGVFLELVVWEDFLDALSQTRLQDAYNEAIRDCDIFVMLFWTKVGRYTEEEFDTAVGQFKTTENPFIYTYFKTEKAESTVTEDERSPGGVPKEAARAWPLLHALSEHRGVGAALQSAARQAGRHGLPAPRPADP